MGKQVNNSIDASYSCKSAAVKATANQYMFQLEYDCTTIELHICIHVCTHVCISLGPVTNMTDYNDTICMHRYIHVYANLGIQARIPTRTSKCKMHTHLHVSHTQPPHHNCHIKRTIIGHWSHCQQTVAKIWCWLSIIMYLNRFRKNTRWWEDYVCCRFAYPYCVHMQIINGIVTLQTILHQQSLSQIIPLHYHQYYRSIVDKMTTW